jgi:PhzF family phenazine biosynthesis protein
MYIETIDRISPRTRPSPVLSDLPIYQVDAFTDRPFSGNPAAVVPLPAWPDDALLQAIALENGVSETAFLVPATADDRLADYELRWFTPTIEVELCGHATLAAAHVVLTRLFPGLAQVRFRTRKAGILIVTRLPSGTLSMDLPAWQPKRITMPVRLLEALGGLRVREVWMARDLIVVLDDPESVRNFDPDFCRLSLLDVPAIILTAPGRDCDVVSRFFAPRKGIPEDPVTGSAHCQIVPYWANRLGKKSLICRQISSRGGTVQCRLRDDRVTMEGCAVLVLHGTILPSFEGSG